MTLYQRKSFTVPANDSKPRPDCTHEWLDKKGRCVLCGTKPEENSGAEVEAILD